MGKDAIDAHIKERHPGEPDAYRRAGARHDRAGDHAGVRSRIGPA